MALEEGGAGGYSFYGPLGYEQLKQRRAIAQALASKQKGFPKNTGEGLTYLGESIAEGLGDIGLQRREQEYRQSILGDSRKVLQPQGTTAAPAPATTTTPGPQATLAMPPANVNIEPQKPTQVVADQPPVSAPGDSGGGAPAVSLADFPDTAPTAAWPSTPPVPITAADIPPPMPTSTVPPVQSAAPAVGTGGPDAQSTFFNPSATRDRIASTLVGLGSPATAPIAGPSNAPVAGPMANKPLAPGEARSTAYSMDDQGNLVPADTGAQTPPEAPAQTPPGPAAAAPAAAAAPQFNMRRVAAIDANPTVKDAIERAAAAHGIDPSLLKVIAHVESSGIPGAGANTGSYKGLFQLSNGEFKANGGGDIYNPYDNANAAAGKMAAEAAAFKAQTGQDPTPLQVYMIHQQGLGGTISHLQDPNQPAWQAMLRTGEGQQKGEGWAKRAIWGNVPDDLKGQFGNVNNVTSSDLFKIYQAKLGVGDGGSAGNFSVAAGGPARPVSAGGDYTTARAGGAPDSALGEEADTRDAITMALLSQNGQQTPPQQPEDAAPDRLRDVLGLTNRSTIPQRPTASLGRTGVTADTSLPVLAPMGSLGGANVSTAPPTTPPASDPSQRDAVTQALLSQSADVPLADPTGAGAIAPIAGGPGAGAPAPAPVPTPQQSPTIADITPIPMSVAPGVQTAQAAPAMPQQPAQQPAGPGSMPVPSQFTQPPQKPADPVFTTPTDTELRAHEFRRKYIDNPQAVQYADDIIKTEQAKRAQQDQVIQKKWEQDNLAYKDQLVKWQDYQRDQPKREQEYQTKQQDVIVPAPGMSVPGVSMPGGAGPGRAAPGGYDTRLGTDQSPQRSGVPTVPPPPPGTTPAKWAELQAPQQATAIEAVQKATPQFDDAIKAINDVRNHKGLNDGVGVKGIVMRQLPQTDAYAFDTAVRQLGGKNFLEAYSTLRGSGQISNVEGEKATQAQARIDPKQDRASFLAALNDLEMQLRRNQEMVQRKVNMPVTAWRFGGDNSSYAPDIGQRDIKNGVPSEYIGGNPYASSSWRPVR